MVIDFKPRLSSHRLGGRLLRVGAIGIVLAAMSASNSSAAEDPENPGLPYFNDAGPLAQWIDARTTSINYVEATRQWVRLPQFTSKAFARPATVLKDDSCGRLRPFVSSTSYDVTLNFTSSTGAPAPYGYVGPFAVRTVAFGSIPVEAEVQIRQQRDAENLPIGLKFVQTGKVFCAGLGPNAGLTESEALTTNTSVEGQLEVAITSLKVDGVNLKLTNACRTGTPSTIKVSSPAYYSLDPTLTPEDLPSIENLYTTKFFSANTGGLLTGAIDIPAFTGCLTEAGEDVSRLLTTTVSGEGNSVQIRSEGVAVANEDRDEPLDPLPFPTHAP